ncbi:MAG: hypothetical protein NTW46_03840 [Candidatus Nealsonbacteria bacterium]|nr:hypothetical protein [Candidatus Nealsonbacteria bacterium]
MKNLFKDKKFLSFKDMTKKDYGRNAIIGLLAGYVLNIDHFIIINVIGDMAALLGFICGIIWIYKVIMKAK